MKKESKNYAFIDAQNVHLSIKRLGWEIDWRRFRVFLNERFGVKKAQLFIGLVPRKYGTLSIFAIRWI